MPCSYLYVFLSLGEQYTHVNCCALICTYVYVVLAICECEIHLSELKAFNPIAVIRFFIELFMMRVVSWYADADPITSELPRLIVSIDEAQLLLPKRIE